MNKKLLALLLAILMVAVSACAMAARIDASDDQLTESPTASQIGTTIPVTKTLSGDTAGIPEQTYRFELEGKSGPTGAQIPTIAPITITAGSTQATGASQSFSFDASSFTVPGEYVYEMTETRGVFTAGVDGASGSTTPTSGITYSQKKYKVTVTAFNTYAEGSTTPTIKTVVSIREIKADNSVSTDKFTSALFDNVYNSGSLTITKKLTGNAADARDYFGVTVTITAPIGTNIASEVGVSVQDKSSANNVAISYTAGAADGKVTFTNNTASVTFANVGKDDEIKFTNIPYGCTFTVAETGVGTDSKVNGSISNLAYTSTIDKASGTIGATVTTGDTTTVEKNVNVEITNDTSTKIDTGVNTDNTPYILLMALVAIMALAFVAKKRSVRE